MFAQAAAALLPTTDNYYFLPYLHTMVLEGGISHVYWRWQLFAVWGPG